MDKRKTKKKQLRIAHQVYFSSIQTRKQLIRLVTCEKLSVKFAHEKLGINYSTAKMIVRKYKASGKITRFKRQKKTKLKKITKENSRIRCSSQNKYRTVEKENGNPNLFPQISPLQIQTFENPNQDCEQMMKLLTMGNQFYCLPPMFFCYPVPNYFPL